MEEAYVHSKKAPAQGVVLCLAAGLIAACAVGALYALALRNVPNLLNEHHDLDSVMIKAMVSMFGLLALGFGFSVGWTTFKAALWGRIRHPSLAAFLAVACAAVGLYVSWAIDVGPPWRTQAALWIAEIAVILGVAGWVAFRKLRRSPFCEICNTWMRIRKSVRRLRNSGQSLQEMIDRQQPPNDHAHHGRGFRTLDLASCEKCDVHYVTFNNRSTFSPITPAQAELLHPKGVKKD